MITRILLTAAALAVLGLQATNAQQYKSLVITKTDSFYDATIKKDYRKTNEAQVSFKAANSKQLLELPASEVVSHEEGGNYYSSRKIATGTQQKTFDTKLVKSLVFGPASLFASTNQHFVVTYYLAGRDSVLIPLEMQLSALETLFRKELERYEDYVAANPRKKLKPNIKAVYAHLTEYNQFINSSYFLAGKLKKQEVVKGGVTGGVGLINLETFEGYNYNASASPFTLFGAKLYNNYTPRFGLETGISLNHASINSGSRQLRLNTLQLPLGIHYKVASKHRTEIFLIGGANVFFHLRSTVNNSDPSVIKELQTRKVEGTHIGHYLGVGIIQQRRHSINLLGSKYVFNEETKKSNFFANVFSLPLLQLQYTFYPTR